MMVAICDRSPHSARNVNVNDCMIIAGHNRRHHILLLKGGVDVTTPFSTSSSCKTLKYVIQKMVKSNLSCFA